MKLYVITGAGQGIGFELVKQLISAGHYVVWNEIDSNVMNATTQHLNDLGLHNHVCIHADASSEEFQIELNHVLDQSAHEFTAVVCNAGITTFGDFWSYQRASMEQILQVNLVGTFFLIQSLAQRFREKQIAGSIVVMSSVTGHQAHPDLAAYGMTKAALNQLVKNLVID